MMARAAISLVIVLHFFLLELSSWSPLHDGMSKNIFKPLSFIGIDQTPLFTKLLYQLLWIAWCSKLMLIGVWARTTQCLTLFRLPTSIGSVYIIRDKERVHVYIFIKKEDQSSTHWLTAALAIPTFNSPLSFFPHMFLSILLLFSLQMMPLFIGLNGHQLLLIINNSSHLTCANLVTFELLQQPYLTIDGVAISCF